MEDEIDLRRFIFVFYKRRWFIISFLIASVVAGGITALLLKPTYQASAQIDLGNYRETIYTTPSSAKELIVSSTILKSVIDKLGLDNEYKITTLKNSLDISDVKGTSLMNITLESKDPVKTAKIANEISDVFIQESLKEYNDTLQQFQNELEIVQELSKQSQKSLERNKDLLFKLETETPGGSLDGDLNKKTLLEFIQREENKLLEFKARQLQINKEIINLAKPKFINNADVPDNPVKPDKVLIVSLAAFFGVVAGTFSAFIIEFFSNKPINFKQYSQQ